MNGTEIVAENTKESISAIEKVKRYFWMLPSFLILKLNYRPEFELNYFEAGNQHWG